MKKREWMNPIISFNSLEDGGEGTWTPDGSGQSSLDPASWTYKEWLEIYRDDDSVLNYDGVGESGTWEDYVAWFEDTFGETPVQ